MHHWIAKEIRMGYLKRYHHIIFHTSFILEQVSQTLVKNLMEKEIHICHY